MKKLGLYFGATVLLLTSCASEPTGPAIDSSDLDTSLFLNEVKAMDSILSSGIPEKKDVTKAIVLYQDFANYFPSNPKTPDYLFQVSDFHLGSGNAPKAVDVLNEIIEKHPNYPRLETVYFARASHVDFDIRDTTLAKTYYQEFLEKYPESQFADNAKNRFENVALTIEDIIRLGTEKAAAEVN